MSRVENWLELKEIEKSYKKQAKRENWKLNPRKHQLTDVERNWLERNSNDENAYLTNYLDEYQYDEESVLIKKSYLENPNPQIPMEYWVTTKSKYRLL